MTKIGIDFKIDRGSLFKQLKEALKSVFNRSARKNFGDFRPFIQEAVNDAVTEQRFSFIPTNEEAAELGVGVGGHIDVNRTQGAWRQLLIGDPNSIVEFSVTRSRRTNEIGNIRIKYDESEFFSSSLSNIDTPDSFRIRSIPWMDWLINGAPTESAFQFTSEVTPGSDSRTGRGIMIRGGIWQFPPARRAPFTTLNSKIETNIRRTVERLSGEIL
ncbi:hypothetical protein E4G67_03735 [Candidatus Bathyarchaeota archaeon]|nr:MAG: hypothetical protein E4G67_03735 [Candidatus Bathyarchaeota archaeon]